VDEERKDPAQLIRWPAVGLIFVGVADLLISLTLVVGGEQMGEAINKVIEEQGGATQDLDFSSLGNPANLFLTIIGFAITILVVVGGVSMLKQRGWALALVASILTMIPCFGPCCGLFLPIGVWSLIVLMKPAVREAMR
jgi:hypothetical protein